MVLVAVADVPRDVPRLGFPAHLRTSRPFGQKDPVVSLAPRLCPAKPSSVRIAEKDSNALSISSTTNPRSSIMSRFVRCALLRPIRVVARSAFRPSAVTPSRSLTFRRQPFVPFANARRSPDHLLLFFTKPRPDNLSRRGYFFTQTLSMHLHRLNFHETIIFLYAFRTRKRSRFNVFCATRNREICNRRIICFSRTM